MVGKTLIDRQTGSEVSPFLDQSNTRPLGKECQKTLDTIRRRGRSKRKEEVELEELDEDIYIYI